MHLVMNSPSPAQQRVKADFCSQCPDGASALGSACTEFFVGPGGSPGIGGLTVLLYNDQIAATIDRQCALMRSDSGGGDCAQAFVSCANAVIAAGAYVPPSCP